MGFPRRSIARMTGWPRLGLLILAVLGVLTAAPVAAQTAAQASAASPAQSQSMPQSAPPSAPPSAPRGAPMTTQAYQGLSCIVLGTLTTIGVYIYSDVITEVLTGSAVNAVLLIPVMALGFASGCSVGSTMGPGVQWIVQQFQ